MSEYLTLKDLLLILLRNLKKIVVLAVVFGVIFGGVSAFRVIVEQTDYSLQYARTEQIEQQKDLLIDTLYELEHLYDYRDISILYSFGDSSYVYEILFAVSTQDSSQDLEITIIEMYLSLLHHPLNDMFNGIKEIFQVDLVTDNIHISRLIAMNNPSGNLLHLRVRHFDDNIAIDAAEYIIAYMSSWINIVSPHSVSIIAQDISLDQNGNVQLFSDDLDARIIYMEDRVTDIEAMLLTLAEEGETLNRFNITRIISIVTYMILGLFFGLGAGCFVVVIHSLLSGRVLSAKGVVERYKFPLIGILPVRENVNRITKFFKIYDTKFDALTYDESLLMVSSTINLICDNEQIFLVGTCDEHRIVRTANELGSHIIAGGNLITNNESIVDLEKINKFILIEERNKSQIFYIDLLVSRLELMKKEIVGIILI